MSAQDAIRVSAFIACVSLIACGVGFIVQGVDEYQQPDPMPVPTPAPRESLADLNLYFSSCAHARSAGARAIPSGRPGYRPGLDGDGDGVACESG